MSIVPTPSQKGQNYQPSENPSSQRPSSANTLSVQNQRHPNEPPSNFWPQYSQCLRVQSSTQSVTHSSQIEANEYNSLQCVRAKVLALVEENQSLKERIKKLEEELRIKETALKSTIMLSHWLLRDN